MQACTRARNAQAPASMPEHAQACPSSCKHARARASHHKLTQASMSVHKHAQTCGSARKSAPACASVPPAPCPVVSTRRGAGSGLEGGRRLPAAANGTPRTLEAASGPRGHRTSSLGAASACRPPAPALAAAAVPGLWGTRTPLGPWAGSDPAAGGSAPPPCRWR